MLQKFKDKLAPNQQSKHTDKMSENAQRSKITKNAYMRLEETVRIFVKLTHINSGLGKWNLNKSQQSAATINTNA